MKKTTTLYELFKELGNELDDHDWQFIKLSCHITNTLMKIRRDRNMTQKELGKILGVSNKTISNWECGCFNFNLKQLCLISSKLEISLNDLLFKGDD